MTFRRVTHADVAEVTAFMHARAQYVMFPLNNLILFGLDGDDPYAPRMWRNSDGPLSDVLSVTKSGMVMPYLPSGDFEAAARRLSGRKVIGFVGPFVAARGLQSLLGLADATMELDADEGHFALDLDQIQTPAGDSHIVLASEGLRKILTDWMIDYHISVLGMSPKAAADIVPDRITKELQEERRVVLMQDEKPIATTAFNAALPNIVQIGGVYTPPALRGHGHARHAVALHLKEARNRGVTKATLFANHPSAISAYEAIGFKRIGDWLLAILETPQVVQGHAL